VVTVRSSVHALQCPRCVLRFASTSELDQHLRLDHQPPEAAATAAPERVASRSPDEPPAALSADESARLSRFIVRFIPAAAVIALISVLSWRAAALLTVAAFAGATLRSTICARSRHRQARI
jgi:hypothetical protein